MPIAKKNERGLLTALVLFLIVAANAQSQTIAPELQSKIDAQAQRLKSNEVEIRRDAAHQLRLLENAAAGRVAATALNDSSEIVRVTAAEACAYLADEEAAQVLAPLLVVRKKSDIKKNEFTRREAAFALGEARSKTAVPNLIETLQNDKSLIVRAAAAVALGQIQDERAVIALSQTLSAPHFRKKDLLTQDEFLRRSAARALGEIRQKNGVPALIAALRDTAQAAETRRESARALGLIADQSAVEVLRENANAPDYLLAEIAQKSLEQIKNSKIVNDNQ